MMLSPKPSYAPASGDWKKVPEVLDSVSASLMSLLPNSGGEDKLPTTFWNLEQSSAPMQGRFRPFEPCTPRRPKTKESRSRSPPPAPNQKKLKLGNALEENDLVEVVSILAKNPRLANMPLCSNELPLDRAMRLHCDDMIIEVLKDNGAQQSDSENQHNFMNNVFFMANSTPFADFPTW